MIIGFDLDGTLLNTEKWVINALKESFKKNKKKVPKKREIAKYLGETTINIIKKSSYQNLTKKEIKNIKKDYHKAREKTIKSIKAFSGTKKILRKLRKNYYLVIISNTKKKEIIKRLKITKIDKKLFRLIIGPNKKTKAKPFPDEIYKEEKILGEKIKFLVGDTFTDISAAKKAKVKSVILLNKSQRQKQQNLKKADFIINNIKQLPKIIKDG
jgi:phosphoglycolate phosphatase-like HAD superfamily hydrolase